MCIIKYAYELVLIWLFTAWRLAGAMHMTPALRASPLPSRSRTFVIQRTISSARNLDSLAEVGILG